MTEFQNMSIIVPLGCHGPARNVSIATSTQNSTRKNLYKNNALRFIIRYEFLHDSLVLTYS